MDYTNDIEEPSIRVRNMDLNKLSKPIRGSLIPKEDKSDTKNKILKITNKKIEISRGIK